MGSNKQEPIEDIFKYLKITIHRLRMYLIGNEKSILDIDPEYFYNKYNELDFLVHEYENYCKENMFEWFNVNDEFDNLIEQDDDFYDIKRENIRQLIQNNNFEFRVNDEFITDNGYNLISDKEDFIFILCMQVIEYKMCRWEKQSFTKEISEWSKEYYVNKQINKHQSNTQNDIIDSKPTAANAKVKWLGTPSQFGIIINELVIKGYLELPASAHKKNAAIFLSFFDINTTEATLSKELSTNTNSMSVDNARKLVIIHKDKLT